MNVICPSCHHDQHFDVDVKEYKGYVCPSCYSYFKVDYDAGKSLQDFLFVKKFDKPSAHLATSLNEKIKDKKTHYHIITLIERSSDSNEISFEYVGLSNLNKDIYFAHSNNYMAKLYQILESDLTVIDDLTYRYAKQKYNLEYDEKCIVLNAVGFVFEDLTASTQNKTYIHSFNENKFLSKELIDNQKEFYIGTYLESYFFKQYFKKFDELDNIGSQAELLFYKIIGAVALIITGLFLMFNFNNFKRQKLSFDEVFHSPSVTNQFVGESFTLSGNTKRLIFDGISETNNKDLNLWVRLVNETTNEVQESKILGHYSNDINFASGITVEFCRVPAGTYHMVFETSSNHESTLEYKIDYRLLHGKIDWTILVIGLIILFVIAYFVYKNTFMNEDRIFYDNLVYIDYKIILKQDYLGYILLIFSLSFGGYMVYQNYIEECTTSTSLNTLEDHTYTGSRVHYYRSYNSYGSGHK